VGGGGEGPISLLISPTLRSIIANFSPLNSKSNSPTIMIISSSLPYSYSKLMHDLREIEEEAKKQIDIQMTIGSVGLTVCENEVPEVTITGKQHQ